MSKGSYIRVPGENSARWGKRGHQRRGDGAIKVRGHRHQVLALEAVLATGEVIRTGGKFVKASTGYDLTQLIVGSEGTLGARDRSHPEAPSRAAHASTILIPFGTLDQVTARYEDRGSGAAPLILEYIDMLTMRPITANVGPRLGIPKRVQDDAAAYLVVVLENTHEDRLEDDVGTLADLLVELGALEIYVLPAQAPGS